MNHHTYAKTGLISDNSQIALLENIRLSYERHYMSLIFYSDERLTNVVSMVDLSGVVQFEVSDNGVQFGRISVGDNTDGELTLGSATYPRPSVQGSIQTVRLDFTGITAIGAAQYYKLTVNSHGGY